jgi:hypothetical protein
LTCFALLVLLIFCCLFHCFTAFKISISLRSLFLWGFFLYAGCFLSVVLFFLGLCRQSSLVDHNCLRPHTQMQRHGISLFYLRCIGALCGIKVFFSFLTIFSYPADQIMAIAELRLPTGLRPPHHLFQCTLPSSLYLLSH